LSGRMGVRVQKRVRNPNGGLAVGPRKSGLSFGIMRLIDDSSECNFLESLQGPYNEIPSTKAVRAGLFHQPTNVNHFKLADVQAIFFRRRHQRRRPPPAKIRPGSHVSRDCGPRRGGALTAEDPDGFGTEEEFGSP